MGITIAEYRSRIGSFFGNRVRIKHKQSFKDPKQTTKSKISSTRLLILVNILLVTFTTAKYYDTRNYSQQSQNSFINLTNKETVFPCTDIENNNQYTLTLDVNFMARYKFGNRQNRGIKIASWNKGGGYLQNKIHEIENIIASIHPHILGITESNFYKHQDRDDIRIVDYDIITSKTLDNPNLEVSRVVVYKHKSIVSKTRLDLMDDNFSSIWIECGLPNKNKFLVCHLYREWQFLNQENDSSKSIHEQLVRWLIFLDQWERALATGKECHVVGDININHLNWTKADLPSSSQTYKLRPLIEALFTRIFPHGVKQCVTVATRFWPGHESSGLDHYYTNKPSKLSEINVQHRGGSDHKLILGTRYSKNIT